MTLCLSVSRRRFLQQTLALPAMANVTAHAAPSEAAGRTALGSRRLVLLTLNGGNDGLNTVVPHRDRLYARLRPAVGLPARRCLPLNDDLALHPRLTALRALFDAGEVALVQDVGYPQPNLSHFVSADAWSRGGTETRGPLVGWFAQAVTDNRTLFDAAGFDAASVVFGADDAFARGQDLALLMADQLPSLAAAVDLPARAVAASDQATLAQQLATQINLNRELALRVQTRLAGAKLPHPQPQAKPLLQQVEMLHWLLARGVTTPVVRLSMDGFDTHSGQLPRHAELMAELDAGLADLRQRLQAEGMWGDTLVLVQSEFGRRPAQNGYDGTDHGTAGPVFLLGGGVGGGVYGRRSALDDLDAQGNLRHGIDFRQLYATVLSRWWHWPVNRFAAAGFAPLEVPLG